MIRIYYEEYRATEGQIYLHDGQGDWVQTTEGATRLKITAKRKTRTFRNMDVFIKWNARHVEHGCHIIRPRCMSVMTDVTDVRPIAIPWSYNNTHGIMIHEIKDTKRGILFSDGAYTKMPWENKKIMGLIKEGIYHRHKELADKLLFYGEDKAVTWEETKK